MPGWVVAYVRFVEPISRRVGRASMYLIFVMMAVLFYSSGTKALKVPAIWTLDVSEFLMVSYFLIGGAYALQIDGHVRMDLLYGSWSQRTKTRWDVMTSFFLVFYLGVLLYGSVASTIYAFEFGERAFSAWRPYMWPVKCVMTFGILLTLLQTIATFFRDLANALGKPLP
ncbi:MAG: TRAP transporter small permease subunit [Alphaproteobacteria bacterium]|nr:TRAP transporter small permease subunit [Alphaproteobacteria bacterium]